MHQIIVESVMMLSYFWFPLYVARICATILHYVYQRSNFVSSSDLLLEEVNITKHPCHILIWLHTCSIYPPKPRKLFTTMILSRNRAELPLNYPWGWSLPHAGHVNSSDCAKVPSSKAWCALTCSRSPGFYGETDGVTDLLSVSLLTGPAEGTFIATPCRLSLFSFTLVLD